MENQVNKKISYFVLFKIFFRLYGLYLSITGFLNSIVLLPRVISNDEVDKLFMLTRGEEFFSSIITVISGVMLLLLTNILTTKMVKSQRELSIEAEEIKYITYYTIQFLLTIFIVSLTINIVAAMAILLYFYQTYNSTDLASFIIPLLLLFVIFIIKRNCNKVVRFIIK